MTQPADDFDDFEGGGASEQFETKAHQDHLLIVKLWDEISPVVTEYCPTGYVTRGGKEWPNNALRAAVVDLDMDADDGTRGRVYPQAMILTGLLIAELKHKVGKTLLLIWKQKDPSDKSSPYTVYDMKNDGNAVDLGRKWLNDHPEFKAIPAPPPWTVESKREESRDNGYRRDREHEDRRNYEREYVGDRDRRDERPPRRDEPPRYRDPRDRDYDPRYDDRGRQERSRGTYDRPRRDDDRDGSFMSRSAESGRRGYQEEEPPF